MMDYGIWGLGTALIGVCCLLLGYLLGAWEEQKSREERQQPKELTPAEKTLLERQLDEIIEHHQKTGW